MVTLPFRAEKHTVRAKADPINRIYVIIIAEKLHFF